VSANLHYWIDLIWGTRRRGESAKQKFNVIPDLVFEFDPTEYTDDNAMLQAKSDEIHNCGHAPRCLFTELHPPRVVDGEKRSLHFKREISRRRSHTRGSGTLDEARDRLTSLYGNLAVAYVWSDREWYLFAHSLPIVSVWKGTKMQSVLCGHLETISSLYFECDAGFAVVGHKDGVASLFSVDPFHFIRIIHTDARIPITLAKIFRSEGSVLLFQDTERGTVVSLWTVNGELQGSVSLDEAIMDCAVTSFPSGTKKNYAICLAKNDFLVTLKLPSLKHRPELSGKTGIQGGVSIKLENDNLTVLGTSGTIKWKLVWSK
jgi:hypothetical protein